MGTYYPYDAPDKMNEAYIENDCKYCPFCDNEDIEGRERQEYALEVVCNSCGESWLECYKVTGIMLDRRIE